MKKDHEKVREDEILLSLAEFLASYNKNMPQGFPHASVVLLQKFQVAHAPLFKHGNLWSLDQHRKKLIDWLPRNISIS